MMRAWLLGGAAAATVAAALVGCNGLLGIGAASMAEDAGEGGPVMPARSLTCAYYCATIVQNCSQQYAEFVGSEDATSLCMAMCPALDQGSSISPSNDDTLGCRTYYAEQAATDPATNCRIAGLLGGGTCGKDPCQLFCELDVQYCASVGASVYTGLNDCTSDCEAASDGGGGYPYLVPPPPDSGCPAYDLLDCTNTLNCRFWHLQNAYGSSANGTFHCPHTELASMVCK
jgi:hypothetical protein